MSVSLLSQPQMQSALGLGSGGSGSGVASLNALVGSVNLTSADSSISIVADPSANTLNIQSAGGAGGVEGTLYVGSITTVDSPNIVGSVAERIINLGLTDLALTPLATYRYQLTLQSFTLTNSSQISTAESQCAVMPYIGNSATQPPASQESLVAQVFTPSTFGLLQTDVAPYDCVVLAQGVPPSSQTLAFPRRFVCSGFFVAGDVNVYLNLACDGSNGGFNPNLLHIASGTLIPYELFLVKCNTV